MPIVGSESTVTTQQKQKDLALARSLEFEPFCYEVMSQGKERMSFFNQMTVLLGMRPDRELLKTGASPVDSELLSSATSNLKRFYFVGFTEFFSDDCARLSLLMGDTVFRPPNVNCLPIINCEFSKDFSKWLAKAARFDILLYDAALQK